MVPVTGNVVKLINWGDSSKLAFSTTNAHFVIINGTQLSSGIKNIDKEMFSIYPNPTTDEVFFNYPTEINVEVLNLFGEKIMKAKSVRKISMLPLSSGIYTLSVTDLRGQLLAVLKLARD